MFESKTCKVEESEFKIDGGEIKIVVNIHTIDKGEFKYSGSKCKLIMKSHVLDGSMREVALGSRIVVAFGRDGFR